MTSCRDYIHKAAVVQILLLILAVPSFAQEKSGGGGEDGVLAQQTVVEEAVEQDEVSADEGESVRKVETHTIWKAFAGYRLLGIHSYGGNAAPYDYLHSSPVGGLFVNSLGKELKFGLDGVYNNEKDYHGDLLFDYGGDYRFHLRTESFFHNLNHELLFTPPFTLGVPYTPVDLDPLGRYGIKAAQDLADFRLKLPDFPLHLNLRYWRMSREGNRQLIFGDQSFEGTSNFIYSTNRQISRQTNEGSIGFDAHLGVVDIIYDFKIRQFGDNVATPMSPFVERPERYAGIQQHNEDPDSRFTSHTVKAHTSLAGGLVGAASYTYGRRENLSQLTDVWGANRTVATLQNIAGDLAYTPCGWFTLAVKFRRQEVDNSAPAGIVSAFAVHPDVLVRPSIDSQKDTVTVTLSARPDKLLTFKGEFRGEFLHRDNVSAAKVSSSWYLPKNEDKYTGTFSILSRPIPGLRLKALYSYSATVHPSYGTSFSDRHEGQFLATYNKSGKWGLTANYRARRESNDAVARDQITSISPLEFSPYPAPLGRGRSTDNATASVWFSPFNKLTITGSYGFMRSSIDQAVLFTVIAPAVADTTNYTNQAQIYSLNTVYQMNDRLDLSLALQQIHSFAEFSPTPMFVSSTANTAGINLLSRSRTVESSVSARANYNLNKNVSCSVDYTYRDYDDKNPTIFNGSVNSIMAYLSAKW